jgi:hypothetical protein
MVLPEGQAYSFAPKPAAAAAVATERKAERPPPKPAAIAIQYLGFQNVGARRDYLLQVGRGEQAMRHVVSIELAAFSLRLALLQDGPDICYQVLLRALAAPEQPVAETITVTEADLAAYRAAHTMPGRRRSFSAPPEAAPGPAKP